MASYLDIVFSIACWPILILVFITLINQVRLFLQVHPSYFDKPVLSFLFIIILCLISKALALLFKTMDWTEGINFPLIDVTNMITDISYWILLSYFILEMKVVRDLISSSD